MNYVLVYFTGCKARRRERGTLIVHISRKIKLSFHNSRKLTWAFYSTPKLKRLFPLASCHLSKASFETDRFSCLFIACWRPFTWLVTVPKITKIGKKEAKKQLTKIMKNMINVIKNRRVTRVHDNKKLRRSLVKNLVKMSFWLPNYSL